MIGDDDLAHCLTFADLMHAVHCAPPRYKRVLDAMEAIGFLERVCEVGDEVMRLLRTRQMCTADASRHLEGLLECVRAPLRSKARLDAVTSEIGESSR